MLLSFNMTAFQERFYLHEVELFLFAVICQMFFLVFLSPELSSFCFLCTPHPHWILSVLERPLPIGSHWIQHLWVFSQLVNHRNRSFVCIYLLFGRKRDRKKVFCVILCKHCARVQSQRKETPVAVCVWRSSQWCEWCIAVKAPARISPLWCNTEP